MLAFFFSNSIGLVGTKYLSVITKLNLIYLFFTFLGDFVCSFFFLILKPRGGRLSFRPLSTSFGLRRTNIIGRVNFLRLNAWNVLLAIPSLFLHQGA